MLVRTWIYVKDMSGHKFAQPGGGVGFFYVFMTSLCPEDIKIGLNLGLKRHKFMFLCFYVYVFVFLGMLQYPIWIFRPPLPIGCLTTKW